MKCIAVLVSVCALSSFASSGSDSTVFPVPFFLEKNVVFWKKIYSEISLREGLLHDAEYPLVIFKKLDNDPSPAIIKAERDSVVAALTVIATMPESLWTQRERGIVELYKSDCDTAALAVLAGATERVRFQRGQKNRFAEGLERSGLFIDTIRAIFRSYGVPERIAYLPHVESSFNTAAYSKVGAAGLWQFMRQTGRTYGMTINYSIDERRDPVRATVAAAQYLAHAYEKLGSWPLAITSYNAGVAGMMRAVAQTGSNDISVVFTQYSSPSFRFASRNFYSCFIAASEIAASHELYFPGVKMMSPVKYTDVKPGVAITPSVICRYFNVSSQELAAMNPAIRPVIIMHNKQLPPDLTLHLPATLPEDTVLAVLGSIPDSLKSVEPEQSHYYQVERGDNLSVIAVRLGVSVRDLIAENDLPANARIRAGQMLRVPGRAPAVVLSCASEKPRTAALKPVVDSIRPAIVEGESAAQQPAGDQGFDAALYDLDAAISPDGRSATIRVSVDETISHYSEWLAVPAAQIIKLNEIGPRATLRTGQKLRLPFAGPAAVDAFSTARLEYHMAIEEDFYMQFRVAGIRDHVIVSGENIWSICNTGENQIPEWLFRKYNKKTDLAALRSGDIVRFPVIVEKSAEDKAAAGDIIDNRNCWPGAVLPLRGCPRPVRILP